MKNLIALISLVSCLSVSAGVVECFKKGRYIRPANELAFQIASTAGSSKLLTCTGESFLEAVQAGNHRTKLVNASPERIKAFRAYKNAKKSGKLVNAFMQLSK